MRSLALPESGLHAVFKSQTHVLPLSAALVEPPEVSPRPEGQSEVGGDVPSASGATAEGPPPAEAPPDEGAMVRHRSVTCPPEPFHPLVCSTAASLKQMFRRLRASAAAGRGILT